MSGQASGARLVPDLLRQVAEEDPDLLAAVVDGGERMTYAQWEAWSNALARHLAGRGLEAGERVGLCYENAAWVEYAVAYLGTLKAGGVAVPLSSRFAPRELRHVLAHSGARGVLAQAELVPAVEAARPPGVAWVEGSVLAAARSAPAPWFEPVQVPRQPADLADILYTSGTTGLPKGVASSHANLTFEHTRLPETWRRERFLHAIPLSTFAGTHAMLLLPLRAAMTNVVMPRFDAERYCELVAEHRAAVTYLVPAMARLLVDSGAPGRHDVSSLRVVFFGAAPMPPDTLARLHAALPGATLVNLYGMTEAGSAGTSMPYDPARPASVGRPTGASRVRVTDAEGRELPPGEVGEIWIGLPEGMPTRTYFADPEASAQTFREGWVRTGDLGYLDEEGYLYLVDRAKDIIIRGGYNVSSVEVEGVLHEHPAVREAAVVGVPHEVLGEEVAAVVVLREGQQVGAEELRAFCRERLADYKCPRVIEFVPALPRNALGKVLKRELRTAIGHRARPAS